VTLRYAELIANLGVEKAVKTSPALALGVNCWDGVCTYRAVAEGVNVEYTPLENAI
jgi:alanine dehydrogenase